jgi:phage portal protein BeeE
MRPGSVFHMQGQTTDGLSGSSPIADLRKTLSLAQAAGRFAGAVFDNGARPGTVVTHPKTLSTDAQERLIAQMEDLKGSSSANKTVLLEEGMTVTPIGFPPEDAMFLETQLNQHRLIYGAYGIPPHKVGDLERATFSNIEHQALEYIQDGALPWLVNAEQEFAVQLIDEDDVFAEFLVDGYLRGDAKSRAEALAIRLQNGTLTQDQWRALENENPLPDGTGAQTWMAVNYAPPRRTGSGSRRRSPRRRRCSRRTGTSRPSWPRRIPRPRRSRPTSCGASSSPSRRWKPGSAAWRSRACNQPLLAVASPVRPECE